MEKIISEKRRIPRPRGVTQAVIADNPKAAQKKLITAYLAGTFPFQGSVTLAPEQFSELYNIPIRAIHLRIKDGLVENMLDGTDLAKTLEDQRLKSFNRALFRIGVSDHHLDRLTRKLAGPVLESPRPHPMMVKEFNAAIGNQIRLTETELKTIVLMNQALTTVDPGAQGDKEDEITRAEILDEMDKLKADPKLLAHYVEGTPELAPAGLDKSKKRRNYNKEANHDWNRELEVDPAAKMIEVKVPIQ